MSRPAQKIIGSGGAEIIAQQAHLYTGGILKSIKHKADFCVVGGGLAGMCAAISAARRGIKVVLIHDRPVFGGNASSEIRMWISGAHGDNNRETGILEEIELENMYRNPYRNYSIWDSVLYGKAKFQENLTTLLNCSCSGLEMDSNRIARVKAWQLTSETWHTVEADYFADCSGDSILAPLSGAGFRIGREAAGEFGESIAPEQADRKTMGMSCLIQARETEKPRRFIPPVWANKYLSEEDLSHRKHGFKAWGANFWWIEIGGEGDSVHGAEQNRDELMKIALGIWDHIKNRGDHGAENWALDWVGFLPGKRESRRYSGEHILTQSDVESGGKFDDIAAYGGWSMDDHHPGGMNYPGEATIFHPAPSPFGIPYRCFYSKNIENLFFAGRNISATHAAMSSTRVMATCAVIGQAVGTAAAIASKNSLSPAGVHREKIHELQKALLDDDCFLPGLERKVSGISLDAKLSASEGNPEPLRNGFDRPVQGEDNGWTASPGSWVEYLFKSMQDVKEARFVFDSNLNREEKNMMCNYPLIEHKELQVPETLVKKFRIEVKRGGAWEIAARMDNNYQRLVKVNLDIKMEAVRFVPEETWGSEKVHVFSWEVR